MIITIKNECAFERDALHQLERDISELCREWGLEYKIQVSGVGPSPMKKYFGVD